MEPGIGAPENGAGRVGVNDIDLVVFFRSASAVSIFNTGKSTTERHV